VEMRRSIRDFSPKPVDKALIESILSVAQYAPSAGNTQTVQWLVVYDPAKVHRVSELVVEWMRSMLGSPHPFAPYFSRIVTAWDAGTDVVCQGAPHLLFAHLPANGGDPSTDAIIALTHFDLLAPAFGLGACWAGFIKMALVNYPPLVEFLGLPADRIPVYALFFGYPTVKPVTIPRRNPVRMGWV
jgi:nitroreductase